MSAIHTVIKTAISLPREDFRLIEQLRRKTGKSRSQIFLEAFRLWVREQRNESSEKRYAEAYQRLPEQVCDSDPLYKASLETWEKDTW